jgi:hypothetical protein
MTRSINLDFTITYPPHFKFPSEPVHTDHLSIVSTPSNISFTPTELPGQVDADKNGLIEQGWTNALKRFFIPGFASSQDKRVSDYFMGFFIFFFEDEGPVDKEKAKAVLSLAERHIDRHQGGFPWESPSSHIARLKHYTLAARKRLNLFHVSQGRQVLTEKCRSDNKALLSRWTKAGFSEEAFWSRPDLVDFIFRTHLHRNMTHPYYRHTIQMQNCLARRDGQIIVAREPHLLFNGRQAPWSEIRKKIHVDSESRLYSKENGVRKRWVYLENGFTQLNDGFDFPQRLRKLDSAPASCQIQIVTTHAHKEDWNLVDRVLEGTRHSFLRIIPGEGFSVRYPDTGMEQGSVYSLGWGTIWRDFNIFLPLSTLQGRWCCPDDWEFFKQDHCVTTLDVTDQQVIKLMEIVRKRSKEELPFHFITANCCGITAQVLSEAGVLDLCTKNHMARLGYEFFIPKSIRTPLDRVTSFAESVIPKCVIKALCDVGAFFYSLVFAPLFTLLGAWRTNISFEDEEGGLVENRIRAKASNRVKALFSNVFDLFNPSKMEFDMTKNIYKWQQQQPGTVFEKRD